LGGNPLECEEEEWDEARVGDAYATDAETGHYLLLFIRNVISNVAREGSF
jgi:hypothetical protein